MIGSSFSREDAGPVPELDRKAETNVEPSHQRSGRGTPVTGRNDYALRREARIERLKARAARMRREAERRLAAVDALASQIPLGQPILVGHHSERHARRDSDRIHEGTGRGLDALRDAEELERRAASAERNEAISSDDPDAVERLREKLSTAEVHRDRWKAINAALRSENPAKLEALHLTAEERRTIRFSEFSTGYVVKNASAEVRRIQQRIQELAAKAERPAPPPETIADIVIEEGKKRVRIRFRGRPTPDVIRELKAHGFHWSRTESAWQRHASDQAWYWARVIAKKAAGLP